MTRPRRRLGRLQNGNAAAPIEATATAPRCGARARAGTPCRCPAVRGRKRCRLHGGCSTGPTTAAGLERCRRARWVHGRRSAAAVAERKRVAERGRQMMAELRALEAIVSGRVDRLAARGNPADLAALESTLALLDYMDAHPEVDG